MRNQRWSMIWAALFALGIFSVVHAAESGWVPPGPPVGAKFTNPLHLADSSGRLRKVDDLMGARGLTVIFVRSADWCPFCKHQLVEINQRATEFAALGFPLVSVSVDEVPLVRAFVDSQNIQFTMLADPTGAVAEDIGIRDAQYPTGSAAFGVPHPGIFVLARDRTILAKFFEPGYKVRPDPDVVLASVRTLAGGATAP
jgi:peroxiredoxin